MKKVCVIFFVLATVTTYSQQLVRGYSAGYAYGLLSDGDSFSFKYNGTNYSATAREAYGSSIHFGFPFDYGVNRHRLNLTPGVDLQFAAYKLDCDPVMYGFGNDSLSLKSFVILPQLGLMYKYHFYAGSLHCALGVGIDIKFPATNDITLENSDKYELMAYESNNVNNANNFTFMPNTLFYEMAELGVHINPRFGVDIYVTRFLVTSISIYSSPLTGFTDTPAVRGFAGIGVSYLMPAGKEDSSRILQYYKQ